jgi:hypothetical protein
MRDLPFLWIFLTVVTVLDSVGLFCLWRRRSAPTALDRWRMTKAERRQQDRRRAGRATSA